MAFLEHLRAGSEHSELFEITQSIMGFVPNSMLLMAERPEILYSFSTLVTSIINPPVKVSKLKMLKIFIKQALAILKSKKQRSGQLPIEIKWMVANVASKASGCNYCQNHTQHSAHKYGVSSEKLDKLFEYKTSPLFSDGERAALDLAMAGGSVPNYSSKEHFVELAKYFTKNEIIDIVAIISLFGFLNRWNDTIKTDLEPIFKSTT